MRKHKHEPRYADKQIQRFFAGQWRGRLVGVGVRQQFTYITALFIVAALLFTTEALVTEIPKEVEAKHGEMTVDAILQRNSGDAGFMEGGDGVPGAYTLEGFKLMDTAIKLSGKELSETDWVMSDEKSAKQEVVELIEVGGGGPDASSLSLLRLSPHPRRRQRGGMVGHLEGLPDRLLRLVAELLARLRIIGVELQHLLPALVTLVDEATGIIDASHLLQDRDRLVHLPELPEGVGQ